MDLQDKRIAITGAFGALGAAMVQAATAAGARVAAIDRAPVPADYAAASSIGNVDLADTNAAQTAIDAAARALGGLDGLVNIAGTFRWEMLADGSADTWDLLYRVNLRTAVAASKAAIPHLVASGAGRIVNISAAGSVKAAAGMGAYAASKSGVARLTEALAEELKDRGVTVNAILPSTIDTAANRADMPKADFSRWVTPAQLSDVIVFLLSDRASAVTGALLPVMGRV
ncbi:MAG: SDR family NAD(P)-dependent oxidoreductase [Proteobacteria bacterium]|nr:SDR family NAD(P)-dependent oxidoreductase [Pseudomonadota bacterium]